MSLGYTKGQFWVPDTRFAHYATWPSYQALIRATSRAGFCFQCSFSYIAQVYTAEIITIEKFQRSANLYTVKHNNSYHEHPLCAIIRAIQESGRETLLLSAVILEIECELLKETVVKAKAREARIEQVLDMLSGVLWRIAEFSPEVPPEPAPKTWDEVFSDLEKTPEGSYVDRKGVEKLKLPRPLPAAPDEDDDL